MKKYSTTAVILFTAAFIAQPFLAHADGTATLQVITHIVNDNGGVETPADFILHVTGAGATPDSFQASADPISVTVNATTTYAVSINPGLHYTASLSPDCSSMLAEDDTAVCTVTLDDIAETESGPVLPNLIANPSFESPLSSNPNTPDQWFVGSFGANTPTFLYPITSTSSSEISSGLAVKLTMSSYTDGDAKWYFTPVAVTAGRQYIYNDAYIATAPTQLIADFSDSNHAHIAFGGFVAIPATPDNVWKSASATFTIPAGAAYMTVYHAIAANGDLTIDNASLTEVSPPSPFDQGFVSLTFDDSLLSQYLNAKPVLDAANLKGTFYVISHLVSGLSISNPSLETQDNTSASTSPLNWLKAGSTNSTYNYPVSGHTGSTAEVSSDKNASNASWYFAPVSVLPDTIYSYNEWYRSTASTEIIAQALTATGTLKTIDVVDAAGNDLGASITLPSTSGVWTQLPQSYFYVPADAKSVTVLHRLTGKGNLAIDDVALGATSYMTAAQVRDLTNDGQEIGGHTQTHPALTTLSSADATTEISGNQKDLIAGGFNPVSFAYPYGDYNKGVEDITKASGFSSGRGVVPGFNGKQSDTYALLSESVNADTTLTQIESWIDEARADRAWLILVFHDVNADVSTMPYGSTPSTLAQIASYLTANNVPVRTIKEGMVKLAQPSLDVVVNVEGTTGAVATSSDVTVSVTGNSPSLTTFSGSALGTIINFNAGTYAATTTLPLGYDVTSSNDCVGTLDIGDAKICTITVAASATSTSPATTTPPVDPTPFPTSTSTLNVNLTVNNTAGGTAIPADFAITVSGANAAPASFAGSTSGTAVTLDGATSYAVTASSLANYTIATSSECAGSLTVGSAGTCQITETYVAPIIVTPPFQTSTSTVNVNVVVNNTGGGNANIGNFMITVTGANATPSSFVPSDSNTAVVVNANEDYTINISSLTAYTPNVSDSCSGALDAGSTVTCQITEVYVSQVETVPENPTPPAPPVSSGGGGGGGGGYVVLPPLRTPIPVRTATTTTATSTTATSTPIKPVAAVAIGKVLGASKYFFTKSLDVGSRGDEVTALQNFLLASGYYKGPITGYFGVLTQAGVKTFQKAFNIEQLGLVGPKTRLMLNK